MKTLLCSLTILVCFHANQTAAQCRPESWQTTLETEIGTGFFSVVWDGQRFVALMADNDCQASCNTLYTSPDGVNWQIESVLETATPAYRMVLVDGFFVVLTEDALWVGTNLQEWTLYPGYNALDADRINGIWVVAAHRDLLVGPDLNDLDAVILTEEFPFPSARELYHHEGSLLVWGPATMATSTDGLSWAYQSMPFDMYKLAIGGNRWIAPDSFESVAWERIGANPWQVMQYPGNFMGDIDFVNGYFIGLFLGANDQGWGIHLLDAIGTQWEKVADFRNLNDLAWDDAGHFVAVAGTSSSSSTGAIHTSNAAASVIQEQPQSQTVCEGETAFFKVIVQSLDPLSFQWYLDETPIEGATLSSLGIPMADMMDQGVYSCLITDACGSYRSESAQLHVTARDPHLPESVPLALGPIELQAVGDCFGSGWSFEWRLESGDLISNAPSVIVDGLTATTRIFCTISTETDPIELETLVLVSPNPATVDPDGDGRDGIGDLHVVAAQWTAGWDYDVDGDSRVTVLDLMYLPTGQ